MGDAAHAIVPFYGQGMNAVSLMKPKKIQHIWLGKSMLRTKSRIVHFAMCHFANFELFTETRFRNIFCSAISMGCLSKWHKQYSFFLDCERNEGYIDFTKDVFLLLYLITFLKKNSGSKITFSYFNVKNCQI